MTPVFKVLLPMSWGDSGGGNNSRDPRGGGRHPGATEKKLPGGFWKRPRFFLVSKHGWGLLVMAFGSQFVSNEFKNVNASRNGSSSLLLDVGNNGRVLLCRSFMEELSHQSWTCPYQSSVHPFCHAGMKHETCDSLCLFSIWTSNMHGLQWGFVQEFSWKIFPLAPFLFSSAPTDKSWRLECVDKSFCNFDSDPSGIQELSVLCFREPCGIFGWVGIEKIYWFNWQKPWETTELYR